MAGHWWGKNTTFPWSQTPMDTLSIGMTMETSVLVVRPNVTTPTYWSSFMLMSFVCCVYCVIWVPLGPDVMTSGTLFRLCAVDAVETESLIKKAHEELVPADCLGPVGQYRAEVFFGGYHLRPLTSR